MDLLLTNLARIIRLLDYVGYVETIVVWFIWSSLDSDT